MSNCPQCKSVAHKDEKQSFQKADWLYCPECKFSFRKDAFDQNGNSKPVDNWTPYSLTTEKKSKSRQFRRPTGKY